MSTLPPVPQQPSLSLPPRVRAGDFLTWSVQTQLAPGSAVQYFLTAVVFNAPVRIVAGPVAVDSFGVATFSMSSATTGTWVPGRYTWVCYAFDLSGNRTALGEGQLWIDADPGGATIADPRSRNERLLANIQALLNGRSLEDAQMYKIGTRELTKMPLKDLLYFEGVYEARVRRERIRKGQRPGSNTIGITFGGR